MVTRKVIDDLRAEIPISRSDAMRWVDDHFAEQAQNAYVASGSPELSPQSGWAIFSRLLTMLQG